MNLQCACLRLAVRSTQQPAPLLTLLPKPPKPANDDQLAWPFVPFPLGWSASN